MPDWVTDYYRNEGLSPERVGEAGISRTWDPRGQWHSPEGRMFQNDFRPHRFVSDLVNSQAGQDYANVSGVASAIGVQGARQGEEAAVEESRRTAASQGLGRGFAAQQETNIRQNANSQATDMVLGAALEERARRFQLASMLASSLIQTNQARVADFLNKRAVKASKSAATLGAIGQIGGALLGAVGGPIAGGIGGLFGGGGGGGQQGGGQQGGGGFTAGDLGFVGGFQQTSGYQFQ